MNDRSRLFWLDYLKLFAMCMVVAYHCPPRGSWEQEWWLFNLGVPLFFYASGRLHDASRPMDFWAFLRRRGARLLVPYVLFFALFYVLWLVAGKALGATGADTAAWWEPMAQWAEGRPQLVLGTFWFVACLWMMQVVAYPLLRMATADVAIAVSVALSFGLMGGLHFLWGAPWMLDQALIYLPLYVVGFWERGHASEVSVHNRLQLVARIVLAMVGIAFLAMAPGWLPRELTLVLSPLAVVVMLPVLTMACQWVADRWGGSRVAQVVAAGGLAYLALQNYLIGLMKRLAESVDALAWLTDTLMGKLVLTLAVMALLYPLTVCIERRLPWMLGRFGRHQ